jgi:hypothetical protein
MFLSESLVRAIEADRAREIERSGRVARLLDGVARTERSPRNEASPSATARTRPTRDSGRTCEPA